MSSESFFQTKNPLSKRLGDAFFDGLPKTPGVYKMYGAAGRLLYVGKAKNLRSRLLTYRRAKPGRENELIREYKPEFNHAKKQHEAYYYLVFRPERNNIVTDLRMHVREGEEPFTYGAFKGHVTVRRGLGAMLRQLYIIENEVSQPFEWPSQLLNKLTPMHYNMGAVELLDKGWVKQAESFLKGHSDELMFKIVDYATEKELLETFIGKVILKNMEALKFFYDRCLHRNYQVIEALNLESPLIPQEKLDDCLVRWAFSKDK